jgi:hypothetical protein
MSLGIFFEAAQVDLKFVAGNSTGKIADHAALALRFIGADPAIVIGIGEGQRLGTKFDANHFQQACAEHVWCISAFAAVFGNGCASAAVAIGRVVADGAGVDVAAGHHFGCAIGKDDTVDFAGVAIDAVHLAEFALGEVPAPLIAEPGIDFLEVHRAAGFGGIGGVDDADARIFHGQAGEIARGFDGIIGGIAGALGELGQQSCRK